MHMLVPSDTRAIVEPVTYLNGAMGNELVCRGTKKISMQAWTAGFLANVCHTLDEECKGVLFNGV